MTIESKDLLVAIKAYSRANPLPLDASEVHDSLEAAQAYAMSAKAYPGQTIKVLQNGVYETYVLNPNKDGNGLALGKVISSDAPANLTNYYTKEEADSLFATKQYVNEAIDEALLDGTDIDLRSYAKLSDLGDYSGHDTVIDYVNAVVKSTSIEIIEF